MIEPPDTGDVGLLRVAALEQSFSKIVSKIDRVDAALMRLEPAVGEIAADQPLNLGIDLVRGMVDRRQHLRRIEFPAGLPQLMDNVPPGKGALDQQILQKRELLPRDFEGREEDVVP